MYKIINSDLTAIYFSKERSIPDVTIKEHITLNISENFLEMLKLSFKVLSFSLNEAGKFSRKDDKTFNMLESRICKMLKPLIDNKNDTEFDNIIAFTLALFNLGVIYVKIIGQIEDTHREKSLEKKAEEYFRTCLYLLKGKELDRKAILIVMRIYNKMKSNWKKQEKFKLRSPFLVDALNTYVKYTKDEYLNPIDIAIILGIDNEDAKELETKISLDNLHIENLKRLSIQYIYFNPDKNMHEFVNYMHNLLNNLIKEESIDKCYIDWAVAAAELFEHFIHHNRFIEARNCLAAASCMLEKYKEKLNTMMTEITTNDNQKTDLDLTFADLQLRVEYQYEYAKIYKLWGQYGIKLLHASKEKLLPNREKHSCEVDDIERECSNSTKSEKESANCLIFTNLEEEIKDKIIQIYDKDVLNSSDIKIVFEKVLAWFNTAMEYFTMESDIKAHGEIILYKSLAYKYFADFEQYKDKRMKLYKQQITLLDDTVTKLSHSHTCLSNIRRLMWLEMGISYAAILDILRDGVIISGIESDQELLLEMKNCICNSMDCFQSYFKMP